MKVVFAQGNPGSKYDSTRHNAGFYMLDAYARAHQAVWNEKTKLHALVAEITSEAEKVLLVKPTTFYNETGRSLRSIVDFYKIDPAEDVLVLHDELALPFGTIRTRSSGSDAGNNGIKSLNAAIGEGYKRIRIGIYSELRDKMDDVNFVVGTFTREESERLPDIYSLVARQIDAFVTSTHIDETIKLE